MKDVQVISKFLTMKNPCTVIYIYNGKVENYVAI